MKADRLHARNWPGYVSALTAALLPMAMGTGCHALSSFAAEVRPPQDSIARVRTEVAVIVSSTARQHHMVPVTLPYGTVDERSGRRLEYVTAFRTVHDVPIFSIMLWAEVRDGALLVRLCHYHPGWHLPERTLRVWEDVLGELREKFVSGVSRRDPAELAERP